MEETGGIFTIAASDAKVRLDVFLTARLGCSRARVQQGIEAGDVLVNGRTTRPSYKLRAGDIVEADLPDLVVATAIVPEDLPLSVLHEDEDLIVIDKPAGMVVHPCGGDHPRHARQCPHPPLRLPEDLQALITAIQAA